MEGNVVKWKTRYEILKDEFDKVRKEEGGLFGIRIIDKLIEGEDYR